MAVNPPLKPGEHDGWTGAREQRVVRVARFAQALRRRVQLVAPKGRCYGVFRRIPHPA